MLLMQFFWKYIDDLMGKGLSTPIILELVVYVTAGLVPLALPLTVLLSSIMMMGNLAENNELTALKSSGLSLAKILKPLFVFMIFLALLAFYFSNYVIPRADLKAKALIYDIQNTKLDLMFRPNTFIKDLQGYTIKVKGVKNNKFKDIIIYDETKPGNTRIIRADSAAVYHEAGGKFLLFHLMSGRIHEEIASSPTLLSNQGTWKQHEIYPSTKYQFEASTIKVQLSGFDVARSDENLFVRSYELMNVLQLAESIDSSYARQDTMMKRFSNNIKSQHPYFLARDFLRQNDFLEDFVDSNFFPTGMQVVKLEDIEDSPKLIAKVDAASNLRIRKGQLEGQLISTDAHLSELRTIHAEFHKKFALSYSVLVLFLIGAPLGAIVKKGGFGLPVVIAVLLFLIYYVLTIVGENMLKAGAINPVLGVWLSSIILTPLAFIVYFIASRDMTFKEWLSTRFRWRKNRKMTL
jgi:lipopolysaccharide export system permease protein